MAFRTNKVPAIEERTVSGSSVSFNAAFALPLKACKVSFSATQAGSGEPSPSNPRAISGVSAIGLTANSTPVSVSLGEERFGGELDVLTGILTVTDIRLNLGQLTWQYVAGCFLARNQSLPMSSNDSASHVDLNVMFDIYKVVSSWNDITINVQDLCGGVYQNQIRIANSNYTDASTFKTAMKDHYVVYQLATPITIQLSANELSSIIGNNTFSTDTGILEITFADLQEKSASGAVASFNTALAMPLVECKTEFMCTQASGTPSPSNPLAITGVDEVAIQHGGVNLFTRQNEQLYSYLREDGTIYYYEGTPWTLSDFIPVIPNSTYHFNPNTTSGGTAKHGYYDVNKNFISAITSGEQTFATPSNAYYMRFSYRDSSTDIMLNFGSTAENYEPYISNTVTLIDLDGTRYGGYVDVVNSKLVVTYANLVFKGTESWSYTSQYASIVISSMKPSNFDQTGKANWLKAISSIWGNGIGFGSGGNKVIYVTQYVMAEIGVTDLTSWKNYLQDHNLEVVYPLGTPIEVDLSDIPTLSTIIGNNSFASDSGSIELKYKDLDIAKRGNFREVFKLPS